MGLSRLLFLGSMLLVLASCSEYSLELENSSEYSIFYYAEFRMKRIDRDTIIRFTQADLWELKSQKWDIIWMESNITICDYWDKINARMFPPYGTYSKGK